MYISGPGVLPKFTRRRRGRRSKFTRRGGVERPSSLAEHGLGNGGWYPNPRYQIVIVLVLVLVLEWKRAGFN
jgi:hypothetical protein